MMNNIKILIVIIVMVVIRICPAYAKNLKSELNKVILLADDYPPYVFTSNNTKKGIFVEIIIELFKKHNITKQPSDIEIRPWARNYRIVQKLPYSTLFLMTLTPARKNMFKWVGPVLNVNIQLIGKKSRRIKINNKSDLSNYRIGSVRKDVGEIILNSIGIKNKQLDRAYNANNNIKKLVLDRIDLVAFDTAVTKWTLKKNNINTQNYIPYYTLLKSQGHFAFNKETPDTVINALQKTLDNFKLTKKYKNIISKYTK